MHRMSSWEFPSWVASLYLNSPPVCFPINFKRSLGELQHSPAAIASHSKAI